MERMTKRKKVICFVVFIAEHVDFGVRLDIDGHLDWTLSSNCSSTEIQWNKTTRESSDSLCLDPVALAGSSRSLHCIISCDKRKTSNREIIEIYMMARRRRKRKLQDYLSVQMPLWWRWVDNLTIAFPASIWPSNVSRCFLLLCFWFSRCSQLSMGFSSVVWSSLSIAHLIVFIRHSTLFDGLHLFGHYTRSLGIVANWANVQSWKASDHLQSVNILRLSIRHHERAGWLCSPFS